MGQATETSQYPSPGKEPNPESTDVEAELRAALNHRRLNPRQIQLFAIAGSIGKYVSGGTPNP